MQQNQTTMPNERWISGSIRDPQSGSAWYFSCMNGNKHNGFVGRILSVKVADANNQFVLTEDGRVVKHHYVEREKDKSHRKTHRIVKVRAGDVQDIVRNRQCFGMEGESKGIEFDFGETTTTMSFEDRESQMSLRYEAPHAFHAFLLATCKSLGDGVPSARTQMAFQHEQDCFVKDGGTFKKS